MTAETDSLLQSGSEWSTFLRGCRTRSGLASCWAQPLRAGDALAELGAQWVFRAARAEPVFEILMHRKWARVQTDRDVRDGAFWQKETIIEAVSITP